MSIGMTIFLLYVLGVLLTKAFLSIPLMKALVKSEGGTETTVFLMVALWPLILLMWCFIPGNRKQ